MFPKTLNINDLQELSKGSMVSHIGIQFTEIGENYLAAKMPVNEKTRQPHGLLHGGASVVLAETLGSLASLILLNENQAPVGLEINANHLKAVKEGFVEGRVSPIHLGKRTHVWSIEIKNEMGQLVCISRLTVAIVDK